MHVHSTENIIKSSCVDIIGNYHQIEGKEGTNNAAYTKGGTDGQIRRRLKRVALAVSKALKATFFFFFFSMFIFVVCNVSNNAWETVFDKKP